MKACRRAWNVALRRNPAKVPTLNPFAQMGLISSNRVTAPWVITHSPLRL